MTIEQFNNIFAMHTYDEARKIIREEIKRMGKSTGSNDSKLQLMEKVVDGTPVAAFDIKIRRETGPKEETGELKQEQLGLNPEEKKQEGKDAEGQDGQQPQEQQRQGQQQQTQQQQGDGEKEITGDAEAIRKIIEQAEAEAERRAKEADEQKKKADDFKKKLEELKRRQKEEEEKEKKRKTKGSHYKTNELIDTLKTTGIAYLVGPAGTGKSTLAMDACKILFNVEKGTEAFSKMFAQISFSPDTTSGEMIGRSDIEGKFHESEVVRVFRDGGLILFDEIDDADSAMLIKLNTAIANGFIATPNGMVKRNDNTYIVCTANTYGTGPDAMYVGRTRLDAATLDRFTLSTIEVDYDTKLEKCIANPLSVENREWLLGFVKKVRKIISDNKFRRLCSTRFVINATKFLSSGKDTKFVEDRFFTGWTDTEKTAVKAA